MARPKTIGGFTLLELLVLVSMIGLLFCFLLPAVHRAREAARRAACVNNLRQLGIAIEGFHDVRRRYPSYFCGIIQPSLNDVPRRYCFSAHAEILDWVGHSALARSINWDDQALDSNGTVPVRGTNSTALASVVDTFLCPSDPFASGSVTSFRLCAGLFPAWPRDSGGVFVAAREKSARDVIDGLSLTAFASERLVGRGAMSPGTERNDVIILSQTTSGIVRSCYSTNLNYDARDRMRDSYVGHTWLRGSARHTAYYHFLPPNSKMRDCSDPRNHGLYSARSSHPNGVNVLFGDGHVAFVGNDIDLRIWRSMATRAGQEVVENF